MKHTGLLNRKMDVKTVYLMVTSITNPVVVIVGRKGGKKSVRDFKVAARNLILAAMKIL